ncbi:MAG: GNAT family N-acetyltransferase [Alphaproteobacteria bacterium]|nr:MAG: GNAT family N-acetyltransferase [Alphaproteobacteria bacterium]
MPHTIQALADLPEAPVLALNNAHEKETSFLDGAKYRRMVAEAFYAEGVAPAMAYLIAFDQDGDYDSPNFIWFRDRYARFAYIDRVVTAPEARGKGLARALYEDLFARARAAGHAVVGCEVNSDPPNPGSDAFHAKLGFVEVGSTLLANGKTVRYLTKAL